MAHGPNTRVYHFAGTEHGLGIWPPTDTQLAAADATGNVERSRNLRGTVNYGRLLRACLVNLDRWVDRGDRAAAQCPRARGRRYRRRSRRADEGLRPHPGRPLSAPPRPAAAARLRSGSRDRSAPHASPWRRPGVRVARVGRRRRRQRGRGHRAAGAARARWPRTPAGTCATRTSAASSSSWSSRARPCPSRAPAPSGRPRAIRARRWRNATARATTISRPFAARRSTSASSATCWRRTSSCPSAWPPACGTSGRPADEPATREELAAWGYESSTR